MTYVSQVLSNVYLFFLLCTCSFYKVFTISKDLVSRVLSKIVESVAEEMSRLMQCVSSFSKNGALQVHKKHNSTSCKCEGLRYWKT